MTEEALKLALEVMRNQGDVSVDEWIATEKAIKEALANEALEKMAENARELGLDYEPAQPEPVAWEQFYPEMGKPKPSMKRDDVICMAREAEHLVIEDYYTNGPVRAFSESQLERFAALVASAESEACAKVCDEHCEWTPRMIGATIRARGQA